MGGLQAAPSCCRFPLPGVPTEVGPEGSSGTVHGSCFGHAFGAPRWAELSPRVPPSQTVTGQTCLLQPPFPLGAPAPPPVPRSCGGGPWERASGLKSPVPSPPKLRMDMLSLQEVWLVAGRGGAFSRSPNQTVLIKRINRFVQCTQLSFDLPLTCRTLRGWEMDSGTYLRVEVAGGCGFAGPLS